MKLIHSVMLYDEKYISKCDVSNIYIYNFLEKNLYNDVEEIYNLTKNIKYKNKYFDLKSNFDDEYVYKIYLIIFFLLYFVKNNIYTQNSNLINYITNEISNIFIFTNNDDINKDVIRKNVFKFISYMEHFSNKLKVKKSIKNLKSIKLFLYIVVVNDKWLFNEKYSYTKYKLHYFNHNYYLYIDHFTSLLKIFKKNLYSKHNFNILNIDLLQKLINNYVYIDKILYKKMLDIYLAKNNIKNIDDLKDIIDKYKSNYQYLNENNLAILCKHEALYNKIKFIENIDENRKIYFSFSFDFRGRLYYDSQYSPTNCKLLRNCIHYGVLTNIECKNYFNNESKTLNIISKFSHLITSNISEEKKICIIWYFISIGKILIDKNRESINIAEFINEGYYWYKLNKNDFLTNDKLSVDSIIELYKYQYIINKLYNNEIVYKYTVCKDATASGIQHLIKILQPYDENSLKYCNMLSEDTWYDTYSYLIKIFFNNNNIDEKFYEYINRTTVKKTIMIENYGASKSKCLKEFTSKIKNDQSLEKIKNIYKKLFDQLRDQKLNNFYKNNFNNIDHHYLFELNDGIVNLSYYKTKPHQLSMILKKKIRNTFQEIILTNDIDHKKSNKALKANITHTSDAEMCRRMYMKYNENLYTIHDCFIINIFNLHNFIDIINNEMKISSFKNNNTLNDINYKIYSIFILI